MLAKFSQSVLTDGKIIFSKSVKGEDASIFGAFSLHTVICLSLKISRKLGITCPSIRINRDGRDIHIRQMNYVTTLLDDDIFEIKLDLKDLCEDDESGLFYYDFVFPQGDTQLYSSTSDNMNISVSEEEGSRFRLLVYKDDFKTPEWFKGGVMYHIFVDRFSKGSFDAPCRPDAEINSDWENGVPQYAEYPGAFVSNNQFFGGNLYGIAEKIDYIASLGATVIYLSPIFKAYSNHKYDTCDYMQVDEMFGGDKALENLIKKAKAKGIKVILDGVFNHTGDDSIYFNKYGKHDSLGAYQSKESQYYNWFSFKNFPYEYESWWG
ncbi:MAG: alpha-amylase family glycosyl hydrolase, partial [Clostridia bacterium]|nr:alpha-amylase family glycosyl hydrolase [Clostridia bacterium]